MNYDAGRAAAASLAYDTHLDYFVADSTIECHRDHLMVGSGACLGKGSPHQRGTNPKPMRRTAALVVQDCFAVPFAPC